ncbi:MAG: hydrogenase small subunit [Armatimonadota bacterium]
MVKISRRDFIKYCGISAAALGLSTVELGELEEALANPNAPSVLWLQGSACTGCSVSFLNRISTSAPTTAADVLINSINLRYHPNIMAAAGDSAVAIAEDAYNKGGYILIVEGGVPTSFNGNTCIAWTYNGEDVTFLEAVKTLAGRASKIICVGTCASFGGIAAAYPNPTGVKSVRNVTGKSTINISGCPPHPDWIVWTIVQLLRGTSISLDSNGRPTTLYNRSVHDQCPRKGTGETKSFGIDKRCLKELGCKGPETRANCPIVLWNNRVNWCVDANAPCHGCTEPGFPGTNPFYKSSHDDD